MKGKKPNSDKGLRLSFNDIQEVSKYIEFLANLPQATSDIRSTASLIQEQIKKIQTPGECLEWWASLTIEDIHLRYSLDNDKGVYLRGWFASFEDNVLEIICETLHTSSDFHYGDDLHCSLYISFGSSFDEQQVYSTGSIKEFVQDAMNYEQYMTDSLKEVEIEMDIIQVS